MHAVTVTKPERQLTCAVTVTKPERQLTCAVTVFSTAEFFYSNFIQSKLSKLESLQLYMSYQEYSALASNQHIYFLFSLKYWIWPWSC